MQLIILSPPFSFSLSHTPTTHTHTPHKTHILSMSLLPVIELCTEYFRNKVVHYLFILIETIRLFLRMFFGKPQIQVRKKSANARSA